MKLPRQFFAPLAVGAPAPLRELPVRLERMIHFVPPHIEKVRAKVPELVRQVDVVLGNLEDAIPVDAKKAARDGFIAMARATDFGSTGLWTRINALNSPWALDDITEIVAAVGNKLDVIMLPKVDGPWDIHYLDQLLAQLEARHQLKKPILIHAILETAQGVNNVEAIASASPRMHGMSLGPGGPCRLARDEDDARRRRTSRLQGARGRARRCAARVIAAGPVALHDREDGRRLRRRRHQAVLRPVRRLRRSGRLRGAVPQRFPDGLRRRLVAASHRRSTSPKRCSLPIPAEVAFAKKIVAAMPDGAGAVMIDGKMQDDATWKQAKVLLDLAKLVAAKDPDAGKRYGLVTSSRMPNGQDATKPSSRSVRW